MRDKVKIVFILTFLMVLLSGVNVFGYTGKGTKANPYVVSSESGLRGALTEHTDKTSWIYIAVDDTIAITSTIQVKKGKYRIYAVDEDQTIRRSLNLDAKVNDADSPKYCMEITGDTQVVFGYNASEYTLTLNGSSSIFKKGRESSGWVYVHNGASFTVGQNCHMKNVKNNKLTSEAAPIISKGDVVINGEISDCEGRNGGAVKSLEGTVQINSTAKIHNCISGTEGGAIYAAVGGRVTMNGGQIYDCSAAEEGGAFFITGTAECEIKSGYIKSNTAEGSAGGVFSGYGATLTIGTTSGTGPEISYNQSGGSGGGIRCDGGSGETAGGVAYIYGGNIHHNTSGKYGGGIACGVSGSAGTSKLIIKNTTINNNTAESDGGGIWIPKAATGINTSYVIVDKCKITNNSSYRNGGGIMLWGSVNSSNNAITANYAKGNGGALCIENQGVFTLSSGTTSQNKSGAQGSGIYLKGKFKILSDAYIDTGNIVYLTLNTYIEVIGKLNKTSGFIAQIDSESKSNGTILVKAAYAGTTASKELYYSGTLEDEYNKKTVVKKYSYYELGENRCLRPSEKVNGYSQYDIILSEKYTIDYDKNTSDDVENMPEKQIKFWEENITISKNQITRNGYGIDEKQHWNLKKDGSGECIKSGETYLWNESKTLYAQWISWRIIAKNRYYAVGQDIVLDKKELLKKVSVENDKENEKSYTFCVTKISKENGETIAKGQDIATEQYISTQEKSHYILTVRVTGNESGNTVETEMDVYVLEIPLLKGRIRFISIKYVSTLQKDSRWNTSLKDQLLTSIKKEEGQGIYKINLSNKEITEIKNTIKSNGYKITREMNLQLIEKW